MAYNTKNKILKTPSGRSDPRFRKLFFQAEDGIQGIGVTGVQTCALPITRGVRGADDLDLDGRVDRLELRGSHVDVGALVGEVGLDRRHGAPHVRLGGGVVRAVAEVEIGRASCRERE